MRQINSCYPTVWGRNSGDESCICTSDSILHWAAYTMKENSAYIPTHTHTHTHNHILHLCRCCHGPTLQPPISFPALLSSLCSQTAHRHVQVSPLGSSAWQETCFQSFALFFSPFLFFSFLLPVFFFFSRLYRCWLITGAFSSCQQRAAAVECLPASPPPHHHHLLLLLPPLLCFSPPPPH